MILRKQQASLWFETLRNHICSAFEEIEAQYTINNTIKFKFTSWKRDGGGGGVMGIMNGNVFEKVGVNISTVYGTLPRELKKEMPGVGKSAKFFATGISLVAHMHSPLIPAAHFNTRFIETTKSWFGGCADLTPTHLDPNADYAKSFHEALENSCNKYNENYYQLFKKQCDEYFYIKHRKEPRGIGGIFYDYLNSSVFDNDFAFTKDIGETFLYIYPKIVKEKMFLTWDQDQKKQQLVRRGRYVEFNLLYDRGTRFGLMTSGNVDAIFMSLPPNVLWL